jgi:pimeloyl-ACP methyl ester carboxylesterase
MVSTGIHAFKTDALEVSRDWSEYVAPVRCPVTLLHGTDDPAVPSSMVEAFSAQNPGFDLQLRDGAGQLLFYDDPAWILSVLR